MHTGLKSPQGLDNPSEDWHFHPQARALKKSPDRPAISIVFFLLFLILYRSKFCSTIHLWLVLLFYCGA